MKKFVTLSAVALAGATIGVGSTFGWWAEDTPIPKDSVQPTNSPAPLSATAESAPTSAPLEVPIAPVPSGVEVSGPGEIPGILNPPPAPIPPKVVYRTQPPTQASVPSGGGIMRDDADRLTRELIKEAAELEKKGQLEAAKIHRKLISRLQRTPRRLLPVAPPATVTPAIRDFPPTYTPGTSPTQVGGVTHPSKVECRMVTKLDDLAVGLAQRAGTLEAEAKRLEEQGQKTLADEKRKLALQLKDLEKEFPSVNLPVPVTRVGQPISTPARVPDSGSEFTIPPHAMMLKLRTMNLGTEAAVLEQAAESLDEEALQLEELGESQAAEKKRQIAKAVRRSAKEMGQRATWMKPGAATDAAVTPTSPATDVVPAPRVQFAQLDAQAESKILELAKDIEQEADRLEKDGKKDVAEAKRSAARRIRETLPKIEFGTAKGWVKIEPTAERNLDRSAISELDKELASLKEAAAKADDPEVRKQLMAKAFELGVKRHMLQSNIPKPEIREREALVEKERLESAIRSLKEDIRNIQPNVEQPESKLQGKPRDPGETLSGDKKRQKALAMALHNYAQQLRAQGHRDQAQALLDQANELEHHLLPRVTRSELVPKEREWNNDERKDSQPVPPRASEKQKPQFVDITLEIPVQEFDYEKLLRKLEHKFPQSKLRLLQESPHSDKMLITGRVADRDDVVSIRQLIHNEVVNQRLEADPHALGGSSSDEVHKILKSLHHEITELRSEVRNLRSVIKKESQDGKRDPEVQKQPGDKDGEQKGKQPGDQDDRPETDDSKTPADSSEDKPQIDD